MDCFLHPVGVQDTNPEQVIPKSVIAPPTEARNMRSLNTADGAELTTKASEGNRDIGGRNPPGAEAARFESGAARGAARRLSADGFGLGEGHSSSPGSRRLAARTIARPLTPRDRSPASGTTPPGGARAATGPETSAFAARSGFASADRGQRA